MGDMDFEWGPAIDEYTRSISNRRMRELSYDLSMGKRSKEAERTLHAGGIYIARLPVAASQNGSFIWKAVQGEGSYSPNRVQNEHDALELFRELEESGRHIHVRVPRAYSYRVEPMDTRYEYLAQELIPGDQCDILRPSSWSIANTREYVRQFALFYITMCHIQSPTIRAVTVDQSKLSMNISIISRISDNRASLPGEQPPLGGR